MSLLELQVLVASRNSIWTVMWTDVFWYLPDKCWCTFLGDVNAAWRAKPYDGKKGTQIFIIVVDIRYLFCQKFGVFIYESIVYKSLFINTSEGNLFVHGKCKTTPPPYHLFLMLVEYKLGTEENVMQIIPEACFDFWKRILEIVPAYCDFLVWIDWWNICITTKIFWNVKYVCRYWSPTKFVS